MVCPETDILCKKPRCREDGGCVKANDDDDDVRTWPRIVAAFGFFGWFIAFGFVIFFAGIVIGLES